jgi:spoIIIJ-associated protein
VSTTSTSSVPAGPQEFEGKTVENAIKSACDHYGLRPESLELEILSPGSTGIFGFGGRKARVRAIPRKNLRPIEAATDQEKEEGRPEAVQTPKTPNDGGTQQDVAGGKGRRAFTKEQLVAASEIAKELVAKAGFDVHIEIKSENQDAFLNISGEDMPLVIGRDGQTLDALEYIVNRVFSRKAGSSLVIRLDAEGYRARKEKSLAQLAHRMAEQAKKTGRSVTLEPMSARDRRIIHLSLRGVGGIRTRSVGEGRVRKVLITVAGPRNKPSRRRPKT